MSALRTAGEELLAAALQYPEAVQESPWGDLVVKVRKKIFVFLGIQDDKLRATFKLPHSSSEVLERPNATPTGYGLGRHGWVSLSFEAGDELPMGLMLDWMDESYRAVALKRLIKQLDAKLPSAEPTKSEPTGHRVLLVGRDKLRLARASKTLTFRGVDALAVDLDEATEVAGEGGPDAIILDVSRRASEAISLIGEVGLAGGDVPLVVCGLRDKKMEAAARALGDAALLCRDAPGDDTVIDQVMELLAR